VRLLWSERQFPPGTPASLVSLPPPDPPSARCPTTSLPQRRAPDDIVATATSLRQATIRALEIRDEADIMRGMPQGELEARVLDAERVHATAPPEVSAQLRLTAQAEADTWQQAVDAATRRDHYQAADAQMLASQISAQRQWLEAASTRYEEWSAATTSIRETATNAKAELEFRGLARQSAEQQLKSTRESLNMAGWWRQFEADITAVDVALERGHQAAIAADDPWPARPEHVPQASPAIDPQYESHAARFEEVLGQAVDVARRIAADYVDREARAEYAARIEREAQVEPEPTLQAQVQAEAEAEL
jgi:hypothetical protein